MTRLNIVFCGTPEFGIPSLELLTRQHNIQAIYTQPDKPAGRGQKLTPPSVKVWAQKHNIPVYQPKNFKDPTDVESLAKLKPDLIIVIAYGIILPKTILEIPKFGCINVHASILPKYRGASPIQAAIIAGDATSGVTIMKMDVGMDTGDILLISTTDINKNDTAATLHDKLAIIGAEALLTVINNIEKSLRAAIPQAHALATYANKINKQDALIDWQQSPQIILQKIRGYNPWPIAFTEKNNLRMKIYDAKIAAYSFNDPPGTFKFIDHKLLITCNAGVIEILKLQLPGGKIITSQEFINNNNNKKWLQ